MIQVQRFTSIDQIDFDALYESSRVRLDAGTIAWPEGVDSPEQRKHFYWERMRTVLGLANGYGFWAGAPDQAAMVGVQAVNEIQLLFGLFRAIDGSRAYLVAPEFRNAWRDFLIGEGFVRGYGSATEGSSLITLANSTRGYEETNPLGVGQVRMQLWGPEV